LNWCFAEQQMAQLDKLFEKRMRQLKSPTSTKFDPYLWQTALSDCLAVGPAEQRLVQVALWIGKQSALSQISFGPLDTELLDPEWQTLLAIASLNLEYRVGNKLVREKLKPHSKKQGVFIDDLRSVTVLSASGTQVGLSDIIENSVDSIESWLFDALKGVGAPPGDFDDLTHAAVQATRAYTWRKSLNFLWAQALHQGSYLAADGPNLLFLPKDEKLERLLVACLAREELNLLNYPMIDRLAWVGMKPSRRRKVGMLRSVTNAMFVNGKAKLKVEALPYLSKHLPAYLYEKGGLEGSYLADFLETPMPLDERVNALMLLAAWHVIRDAAEAMTKLRELPENLTAPLVKDISLVIERSELHAAIANALNIQSVISDAILDILTYSVNTGSAKGHRGLWSAPLVLVPGTTQIALPLPVLITSNPLRKLEGWLEKGGINDSNPVVARGDRYETLYRAQLGASVQSNTIFKTAYCAEHAIKKDKCFGEQIDLLFAFGGLAVVGELKFFLTPTDPHERSRYFDKLEAAAVQAVRKAEALNVRRDVLAKALNISLHEAQSFEILPIVVTNQGFAISCEVKGVRIVDARFLKNFLSGGSLVNSMAFSPRSSVSAQTNHSYYSSEIGARHQFKAEIVDPFVVRRFLDRVKIRYMSMPTFGEQDLQIAAPYLAEVEGFERTQAEMLMGTIAL
jgi:hypothetical protein